jgi:hypothetical protein
MEVVADSPNLAGILVANDQIAASRGDSTTA